MKKFKFANDLMLLGVVFSLIFTACSDGDDNGSAPSSKEVVSISNSKSYNVEECASSMTLENNGYSVKFAIPGSGDTSWTASLVSEDEADEDGNKYILGSLSKEKGKGGENLILYVKSNYSTEGEATSGQQHKAKLTVSYGEPAKEKSIELVQEADSENELTISSQAARMIGYGYNARKGYVSDKCRCLPILNVTGLESDEGIAVDPEGDDDGEVAKVKLVRDSITTTYREVSGSNISELDENLKATVTAELEIDSFTAETEDSFTMAQKKNEFNQYAWTDIICSQYTAEIEASTETLRKEHMMLKSAYNAINGISGSYKKNTADVFKKLVNTYGTHVVVGGVLGGSVGIRMTADQSKIDGSYDAHVMVKAAYEGSILTKAEGTIDATYKETLSKNKAAFHVTSVVKGGDSTTSTKLNAVVGSMITDLPEANDDGKFEAKLSEVQKERTEKYDEWFESLAGEDNLDNNVLIDFGNNYEKYLIPLYEFIDLDSGDDDTKKERKARYDALKIYYAEQLEADFPFVDKSGYVKVVPIKVSVPDFTDSGSRESTLIKDVYVPNNSAKVARVCSEFIPSLNSNQRVIVIYPCSQTKVYWSRGVYIGDESHYPSTVAWNGSNYSIARLSEKRGAISEFYIINGSVELTKPKYIKKTEVQTGTIKDVTLSYGKPSGNYGLVKILDNIYMRNYSSNYHFNDGQHFQVAVEDENAWVFPASGYYLTYDGFTEGQQGDPRWIKLPTARFNADFVFVPTNTYGYNWTKHGGVYPKQGGDWTIPFRSQIDNIINRLNSVASSLPDRSVGRAFLDGGILGLKLPEGVGYVGYNHKKSVYDQYYYESDYGNTWLPVFNDADPSNMGPNAYLHTTRYRINKSSISYAEDGISHKGEYSSFWKYEPNYVCDGNDLIGRRGPCVPLLFNIGMDSY
ncbi:MAG: hypothetical protein K5873_04000 [Treponema sp.]|nr:hypothetical protein [Treponema sp.]